MKINSIFPSKFTAKLSRETICDNETSKAQWLRSYDAQAITILNQKRRAIELDAFMRTSEIQDKLNQLPQNDILEMGSNCHILIRPNGDIETEEIVMTYSMDNIERKNPHFDFAKLNEVTTFYPQRENGAIDKQGIHAWLDNLISLTK